LNSPGPSSTAGPRWLRFLGLGWFSLVMGSAGFALAWGSASAVLGDLTTGVSLVLAFFAIALFTVLALLSVWRALRQPDALAEDLRHPVRHAFVAAVPVSALLLATLAHALGLEHTVVRGLWWAGSLLQLWATVWVLGRWLAPAPATSLATPTPSAWVGVTPLLFIPVVGNVVAALSGPALGAPGWSAAQWGIGVVLWPVMLALVLARRLAHGPLPERLWPSW
jgi:tellurite resistance protein